MRQKLRAKDYLREIFAGLMVAAISIPIGMGYAQIAGLPALYGLYGSAVPILVFTLISTSPEFNYGVDAAPAALIGGILLTLGIESGSAKAVEIIPVLTFYTAAWLLLFYFLKAGRLVNYISSPVMGGFITGIASTVILMQIPKILGGSSKVGELFELIKCILASFQNINYMSLILGLASIIILLLSKKISPKFPMSLIILILGVLITKFFHIEKYGVALLADVERGIPKFVMPNFSAIHFKDGLMLTLPVAVLILVQSLLGENSFASKNNYKIDDNREVLAFSLSNFSSAFVGCCPVNGSVTRTIISEQYGARTKIISFVASFAMFALLMFGTGFIKYLPVPVLTAIVIAALIGVLKIDLAKKLYKINKSEFLIFMGVFAGVLLLGTVYGVVVGVILSFAVTIIKSSLPPRSFLGVIQGKDGFYDINRNSEAKAIDHVVIYRFSGSLFFANINVFESDIENAIKEDTKVVIVDAGGIGSIDITAAEKLELIHKNLSNKGIKFYITEHIGELNDEMRKLNIGYLIEEGVVRRSIKAALRESGLSYPYPVHGDNNNLNSKPGVIKEEIIEEFEWAFGDDAEKQMEKHVKEIIKNISVFSDKLMPETDIDFKAKSWRYLSDYDKDKLLEHLEIHLNEIAGRLGQSVDAVEANIMEHRIKLAQKMKNENKEFYEKYVLKCEAYEKLIQKENPELYEYIMEHRRKQYEALKKTKPEIAEYAKKWI